jgi:formyltetrahydrofolate hydrolase
MKLTNNQIYTYATELASAFQDSTQKFPVKVNFYLQKNKEILMAMAQDIEKARLDLLSNYGELDADTNRFIINPDKMEIAAKELEDLFNLEQEVNIYTVNIDNFGDDIVLTTGQMEALLFMID